MSLLFLRVCERIEGDFVCACVCFCSYASDFLKIVEHQFTMLCCLLAGFQCL